ncbi:hypothetical protein NCY91_19055, partial [Phocaeicola vulgatus]|nr:hypothetical protein [Phocaeicola vulgatus]
YEEHVSMPESSPRIELVKQTGAEIRDNGFPYSSFKTISNTSDKTNLNHHSIKIKIEKNLISILL